MYTNISHSDVLRILLYRANISKLKLKYVYNIETSSVVIKHVLVINDI